MKKIIEFLKIWLFAFLMMFGFGLLIISMINNDFGKAAEAATIRDLGCHEMLVFNETCTDQLYLYCDSDGDGLYDKHYVLKKNPDSLGLIPMLLQMDKEQSMCFFNFATDRERECVQ